VGKHQGEATTSQLGWHPIEPHPMPPNSGNKFYLKKREKEGGTRQKPSKQTRNKAEKTQ